MFKKIILIFIFLIFQHNSYSTINISSCENLDSGYLGSEREINLNSSLTTTNDCISISVDDVILDCKNYNLSGDGGANDDGITITSKNVTIKNCNIFNFNVGIKVRNGSSIIEDSSIYNNTDNGIDIRDSFNNTLKNLKLNFNNDGDNARSGGLILYNSSKNSIININASSNNGSGIYLTENSSNNLFTSIISENNTFSGIEIQSNSMNNSFSDVNSNYNEWGIMFHSHQNNIGNSIIEYNTYGVYFKHPPVEVLSYNNTISNSNIRYNNYGVYFNGKNKNNSIISNTIVQNLIYDIYFEVIGTNPSNNFFYSNTLNSSNIGSDNWPSISGSNFFNLSNQGNTYIDLTSESQICFDLLNTTCDYFPSFQISNSQSLSSIFPTLSFSSTIIILAILSTFFG